MKSLGSQRGGYTIVETLIYLAVTSALFIGVAAMIAGQQRKTEFTQAVREVESYIRDVSNNVATGYYPAASGSTSCLAGISLNPPTLNPTGGTLGASGGCIYLGQLLHIRTALNDNVIDTYTVFGNREVGTPPRDVATLDEANTTISDLLVDSKVFSEAISFKKISGNGDDNNAFAFTSSLATFDDGVLSGAGLQARIFTVPGVSGGDFSVLSPAVASSRNISPGEISICIESNGTNAHAIIVIGGLVNSGISLPVISPGVCP